MTRTTSKEQYLEVLQWIEWGYKSHINQILYGSDGPVYRTDVMMKRLVDRGKVQTAWHDRKRVYCALRKRGPVYHGLGVTEADVRFYLSDRSASFLPVHRVFKGVVPDGGLRYHSGRDLFIEFCTADNKDQRLSGKLQAYNRLSINGVVVFLLDAKRDKVKTYMEKHHRLLSGPFVFCDFEGFCQIPYGQALIQPAYFWWNGFEIKEINLYSETS